VVDIDQPLYHPAVVGNFVGMEMARRFSSAASEGRLISGAARHFRDFWAPAREAYHRWSFGLSRISGRAIPAIATSGDFTTNPLSVKLKHALNRAAVGDGALRSLCAICMACPVRSTACSSTT